MWYFLQTVINGIFSGGVYALIAVGITIIYGVMRMMNFASGAYLMVGMYITYLGFMLTGLSNYLLIPFTIVVSALAAWASFRLAIMPILSRDKTSSIIVTVGLSFFFQNLVILIFGANPLTLPSDIQLSSLKIGSFLISLPRFIAFCVSIVLVLALFFLLDRTLIGRAMRATSENVEVCEMLGVNTKKMFTAAWVLGIVLTSIAGLLLTPIYAIQSSTGATFRTTGLMAVVLGGLGDIRGAFLCGILIGVVEALVASYINTNMGALGIFILLLVVLRFRPSGLFGRGERVA